MISSLLRRVTIEFQRTIDHLWLYTRGMSRVRNSMITKNLFLGGQYSVRRISDLQKLGITAVVNMREEQFSNSESDSQFSVLHLPTADLHPPTVEQLLRGASFIAGELARGGSVYVHCRWGEGRGPSMVIAYLVSTGMTFDDAYAFVKKVRPFIRPTESQIARLQEFAKQFAHQ